MVASLPLRVTVLDAWDEAVLHLPPTALISDLKRAALERTKVRRSPTEYVVKFKGAVLEENGRTLADAGLPANAAVIVLPRRRRPVR